MKVSLGYEIGTGEPVEIPLGHLVVSGQTQLSGKTTTLDAIVHRSKLRAIAFVSKRGEGSFAGAREIPPFYRSPKSGVMWQYVSEVLQAKLGEKMKFERSWIMRVSRGATNLWDVHKNVKHQLDKGKLRELDRSVYEQLDAYFELVLPELETISGELPLLPSFNIAGGINVMRLEKFSTETQMLCVAAVLEHVYHEEEGVITIVPEAWEMVPQGRNTPVKAAAAQMFRKGAGLKNFVWFDSQDLAGVDKQALKQVSVWILGVQREENEAKRMVEHLDVGGPKPKLGDVRTLGIGEFFVSFGKQLKRVYVQPRGVPSAIAQEYAKGIASLSHIQQLMEKFAKAAAIEARSRSEEGTAVGADAPPVIHRMEGTKHVFSYAPTKEEDDEAMENERIKQLEDNVKALQHLVKHYEKLLADHGVSGFSPHPGKRETAKLQRPAAECAASDGGVASPPDFTPVPLQGPSFDVLYDAIKARLMKEAPAVLKLLATRPEIQVEVKRVAYEFDDSTLKGKLALMISRGYFDQTATGNSAFNDLKSRGVATAKPNVYRALDELTSLGFLLKSKDGYSAIPEMKKDIRKAATA